MVSALCYRADERPQPFPLSFTYRLPRADGLFRREAVTGTEVPSEVGAEGAVTLDTRAGRPLWHVPTRVPTVGLGQYPEARHHQHMRALSFSPPGTASLVEIPVRRANQPRRSSVSRSARSVVANSTRNRAPTRDTRRPGLSNMLLEAAPFGPASVSASQLSTGAGNAPCVAEARPFIAPTAATFRPACTLNRSPPSQALRPVREGTSAGRRCPHYGRRSRGAGPCAPPGPRVKRAIGCSSSV